MVTTRDISYPTFINNIITLQSINDKFIFNLQLTFYIYLLLSSSSTYKDNSILLSIIMTTKFVFPPQLTGQDKSSFAYKTIKDRLPVILVKVIDFFHRQRKELHKFSNILGHEPNETELKEIEEDAKAIIADIAKLRKDLETNKPIELFEKLPLPDELNYFNEDVDKWNEAILAHKQKDGTLPQWFEAPWLLVECYLYRRLKEFSLKTKHLKMFDPFIEVKQSSTIDAINQMKVVVNHLLAVDKVFLDSQDRTHPKARSEYSNFLQISLWGNKFDLSISGMSTDSLRKNESSIIDMIESLRGNILCDTSDEDWFLLDCTRCKVRRSSNRTEDGNEKEPFYIDIVCDNSGYELFVDMCLAHFIGLFLNGKEENRKVKFRFHVKRMPWFVSDCMKEDFYWLLDLLESQEQSSNLHAIALIWRSFLDQGAWEVHSHSFWTLHYDYNNMKTVAPDLYEDLVKSSHTIFKGDLNYRKLVGDRKWHILTPFRIALRDFTLAPFVSLRTIKSDTVAGIEDIYVFERINNNKIARDWMTSGNYGLIQGNYN